MGSYLVPKTKGSLYFIDSNLQDGNLAVGMEAFTSTKVAVFTKSMPPHQPETEIPDLSVSDINIHATRDTTRSAAQQLSSGSGEGQAVSNSVELLSREPWETYGIPKSGADKSSTVKDGSDHTRNAVETPPQASTPIILSSTSPPSPLRAESLAPSVSMGKRRLEEPSGSNPRQKRRLPETIQRTIRHEPLVVPIVSIRCVWILTCYYDGLPCRSSPAVRDVRVDDEHFGST